MGFFDSKWVVEFEYRDGGILFGTTKKTTIVVDASSESDAKATAKKVLVNQYKDVKIIKATKQK